MNKQEQKEILEALAKVLKVKKLTPEQAKASRERFNAFKKTEEYQDLIRKENAIEEK